MQLTVKLQKGINRQHIIDWSIYKSMTFETIEKKHLMTLLTTYLSKLDYLWKVMIRSKIGSPLRFIVSVITQNGWHCCVVTKNINLMTLHSEYTCNVSTMTFWGIYPTFDSIWKGSKFNLIGRLLQWIRIQRNDIITRNIFKSVCNLSD